MECGRVAVQPAPLITHGQNTARGQFPWHAALYQSKDINLKYICGGSLIGPKTILTGTGSLESHYMVVSFPSAFDEYSSGQEVLVMELKSSLLCS
jgi:secreted trypsin-like serine protease